MRSLILRAGLRTRDIRVTICSKGPQGRFPGSTSDTEKQCLHIYQTAGGMSAQKHRFLLLSYLVCCVVVTVCYLHTTGYVSCVYLMATGFLCLFDVPDIKSMFCLGANGCPLQPDSVTIYSPVSLSHTQVPCPCPSSSMTLLLFKTAAWPHHTILLYVLVNHSEHLFFPFNKGGRNPVVYSCTKNTECHIQETREHINEEVL